MNKVIFVTMFQQLLHVTGRAGLAKLWKFTLVSLAELDGTDLNPDQKRERVVSEVVVAAKALEFRFGENIIRILVGVGVEYRDLLASGAINAKGQRIKPPSI